MQAPQAMHSYCRPLRMSMPVGQTCTQIVQSMQSPSSSGANFGSGSAVDAGVDDGGGAARLHVRIAAWLARARNT